MNPIIDRLTLYLTTTRSFSAHNRIKHLNSHSLLWVRPIDKHPNNLRRRYHLLIIFQIPRRLCELLEYRNRNLPHARRSVSTAPITPTHATTSHLTHPVLIHTRRITIHGKEIRQTLSQLLILCSIGREVGHDETLENAVVRDDAREHELGEPDAQQGLDFFGVLGIEDLEQEFDDAFALDGRWISFGTPWKRT